MIIYCYGTILIMLSLFFWVCIQYTKKENHDQYAVIVGSPKFRFMIVAGLTLFIILISIMGWNLLSYHKKQVLDNVEKNVASMTIEQAAEIDTNEVLISSYFITKKIILFTLGYTFLLSILTAIFVILIGERSKKSLIKAKESLKKEISERTKIIMEAESYNGLILESVADGIFGVDINGNLTFMNSNAANILGYKPDELIGLDIHKKIHHSYEDGSHYPKDQCPMTKAYTLGESNFINNEILWHKNGFKIPVAYYVTPVLKNQKITGAVITFRDITEKQKSLEIINKLSKAIEQNPVSLAIMDKDGIIEYANPAFNELSDSQKNDLIGQSIIKSIFSKIDTLVISNGLEEIDKTLIKTQWPQYEVLHDINETIPEVFKNMPVRFEAIFKNQNQVIDMSLTAVKDQEGTTQFIVAIGNDITQIKQAEKELNRLNSYFVTMLETTDDFIYFKDNNHKYVAASQTMADFHDFKSWKDLIGKTDYEILSIKYANKNYQIEKQLLSGMSDISKEVLTYTNKNGEKEWLDSRKYPIKTKDDSIIGLYSVARNITEFKKAQLAAEKATRIKSDFLANMSHEIRTPMNAIIGMVYILQQTQLTPKQLEYLNTIDQSASSLLGIINDILDFSKIEAKKMTIDCVEFDLCELMRKITNMVAIKTCKKGVELIVAIHPDTPTMLKGDSLRIKQILINLIDNAIKFTKKGEILVSIEPLDIKDKQEVMLEFSVKDTGIGIKESQKNELFQPFQQAYSSTSRIFGGTGLGLSICKNLVEMMGGKIGLKSYPGKGCTFFFTIKLARQVDETIDPYPLPELLKNLNIMIIDDNETSLKVIKGYLEHLEYRVEAFISGDKALQRLDDANKNGLKKPFDIIFVDSHMPNDIDIIRQIQKHLSLSSFPKIIMLSEVCHDHTLNRLNKSIQPDGLILKPVNKCILYDSIMDVFGINNMKRSAINHNMLIPEDFDSIRGSNILLVEDNKVNQQVVIEILEKEGFYLTCADNGQIGMDILNASIHTKPFDIILMDIQLPFMDGYTLTRFIRSDHGFDHLPIIAMTADASYGVKDKALSVGMNDYISKPIEPEQFFKTLVKWIKPGKRDLPKNYHPHNKVTQRDKETLPELISIDVDTALRRVSGCKTTYKKLIKLFVENMNDVDQHIQEAIDSGNQIEAIRLAHTLKSSSSNIGANELGELASLLEDKLKNNYIETAAESLKDVREKLQWTIDILKPILQIDKQNDIIVTEIDKDQLKTDINHLKTYLKDNETKSETIIDKIVDTVSGTELENHFIPIQKDISNIDYKTALKKLEKIMI